MQISSGHASPLEIVRPTVVLADDHLALLAKTIRILGTSFDIVATANNGRAAVEAIVRLEPDVAILDISMPELDGLSAARIVSTAACATRIVFLTVHDDEDFVSAAIQAGARGYVIKSCMHSDLLHAISEAMCGRMFVSPHPLQPRPTRIQTSN